MEVFLEENVVVAVNLVNLEGNTVVAISHEWGTMVVLVTCRRKITSTNIEHFKVHGWQFFSFYLFVAFFL